MERPNTLFTASDQHGAAPLAAVPCLQTPHLDPEGTLHREEV